MAVDFIIGNIQSFLGEVPKTNAGIWLGRTVVQLQANALPVALAIFLLLGLAAFCYRKYRVSQQPPEFKNTYQLVETSSIFKDSDLVKKCILEKYKELPVYDYDLRQKLPDCKDLPFSVMLLKNNNSYILACKIEGSNTEQRIVLFRYSNTLWTQEELPHESLTERPYFDKEPRIILNLLQHQKVSAHHWQYHPDLQMNLLLKNYNYTWHLASNPIQDPLPVDNLIIPDQYELKYNNDFPAKLVDAFKQNEYTSLPVHQVPIVDNDSFPKWDELEKPIMIVPKKFNKQGQTFVLALKLKPEKLETEKQVAFVQKTGACSWSSPSFIDFQGLQALISDGKAKGYDDINWILARKNITEDIAPNQLKLNYDGLFPSSIISALNSKCIKNLPIHPIPLTNNGLFPKWDELELPMMILEKKCESQQPTFVLAIKLKSEQQDVQQKVAFIEKTGSFWLISDSLSHEGVISDLLSEEQLAEIIKNGQAEDLLDIKWHLAS